MNRWLWLAPILAVLLVVIIFFYWGWGWTAACLVALVLIGTVVMIWGTIRNPQSACRQFENERKEK